VVAFVAVNTVALPLLVRHGIGAGAQRAASGVIVTAAVPGAWAWWLLAGL
jgi:hypothetical protein